MVATCPEIWAIRKRTADLVGRFPPGKDAADIGQRPIDHEPGFLDAEPERGGGIDALGGDIAGRRLAGNSQHAQPMGISERVFHFLQFRGAVQFHRGVAALDRERQSVRRRER